jgi:hypothetical protein
VDKNFRKRPLFCSFDNSGKVESPEARAERVARSEGREG